MATTVTSNDSLQLKSSSLGMENHYNHIRWTPLSVDIFITHVRWLCNECYANDGI